MGDLIGTIAGAAVAVAVIFFMAGATIVGAVWALWMIFG